VSISAPELLTADHDLSLFDCGKVALNDWLKTHALNNQTKGFTRVLVVCEAGRVVGFYGVAPSAIPPSALSRSVRTGRPADPVPCILLGQFAVDKNFMGHGIGGALLKTPKPIGDPAASFRRRMIHQRCFSRSKTSPNGSRTHQHRDINQFIDWSTYSLTSSAQTQYERTAITNKALLASENHGLPAIAATSKPGEFTGKGVVAAREPGTTLPGTTAPAGIGVLEKQEPAGKLSTVPVGGGPQECRGAGSHAAGHDCGGRRRCARETGTGRRGRTARQPTPARKTPQ
jgi:GNAT superfamily N-acetyltransferase